MTGRDRSMYNVARQGSGLCCTPRSEWFELVQVQMGDDVKVSFSDFEFLRARSMQVGRTKGKGRGKPEVDTFDIVVHGTISFYIPTPY